MVLVAKPMFWDIGNHLGPFTEASNRPDSQELGGGAVGGQEELQEVKFQHFQKAQIDLKDKNWVEGL